MFLIYSDSILVKTWLKDGKVLDFKIMDLQFL